MAADTEKHKTRKRLGLLLIGGLVIIVPLSIIIGRQARLPVNTQPASASTTPVLTDSSIGPVRPGITLTPVLTDSSLGPVRIGMTFSELAAAIGPLSDTTKLNKECDYVAASDSNRLPRGVSLLASNGKLTRIDIENDSISTDRGARVGDSEDRIKKLYGAGLIVEPHEYIDGHYLEIKSADGARGIVFETDGKRVTTFRAGSWEFVNLAEGCA